MFIQRQFWRYDDWQSTGITLRGRGDICVKILSQLMILFVFVMRTFRNFTQIIFSSTSNVYR